MFRTLLSLALALTLTGFLSAADDAKGKTGNKQQATITKVDAKNGTVTVRMKDNNGKDVEKLFRLTEDVRYFDSTGKAAAIDVFRSGDTVLFIEAEGRLKEIRHGGAATAGAKAQTDGEFLKTVAQIDMAETKLGELAQNAGQTAAIKKFGERMVTDHSKMNAELKQMAKSQGIALPQKLDQKHQDLVDKLSKVKGTEFDREFAKDLAKGHEHAIKRFEAQAQNGQDPSVKSFAERWLPTLREHLKMARNAAKEVDGK